MELVVPNFKKFAQCEGQGFDKIAFVFRDMTDKEAHFLLTSPEISFKSTESQPDYYGFVISKYFCA